MELLSSNEAKMHFGDLLLKVQREPVKISRNGKPVAVVLSLHDYSVLEQLKMEYLKSRVTQAKNDRELGRLKNGDVFFNDLFDGKLD